MNIRAVLTRDAIGIVSIWAAEEGAAIGTGVWLTCEQVEVLVRYKKFGSRVRGGKGIGADRVTVLGEKLDSRVWEDKGLGANGVTVLREKLDSRLWEDKRLRADKGLRADGFTVLREKLDSRVWENKRLRADRVTALGEKVRASFERKAWRRTNESNISWSETNSPGISGFEHSWSKKRELIVLIERHGLHCRCQRQCGESSKKEHDGSVMGKFYEDERSRQNSTKGVCLKDCKAMRDI